MNKLIKDLPSSSGLTDEEFNKLSIVGRSDAAKISFQGNVEEISDQGTNEGDNYFNGAFGFGGTPVEVESFDTLTQGGVYKNGNQVCIHIEGENTSAQLVLSSSAQSYRIRVAGTWQEIPLLSSQKRLQDTDVAQDKIHLGIENIQEDVNSSLYATADQIQTALGEVLNFDINDYLDKSSDFSEFLTPDVTPAVRSHLGLKQKAETVYNPLSNEATLFDDFSPAHAASMKSLIGVNNVENLPFGSSFDNGVGSDLRYGSSAKLKEVRDTIAAKTNTANLLKVDNRFSDLSSPSDALDNIGVEAVGALPTTIGINEDKVFAGRGIYNTIKSDYAAKRASLELDEDNDFLNSSNNLSEYIDKGDYLGAVNARSNLGLVGFERLVGTPSETSFEDLQYYNIPVVNGTLDSTKEGFVTYNSFVFYLNENNNQPSKIAANFVPKDPSSTSSSEWIKYSNLAETQNANKFRTDPAFLNNNFYFDLAEELPQDSGILSVPTNDVGTMFFRSSLMPSATNTLKSSETLKNFNRRVTLPNDLFKDFTNLDDVLFGSGVFLNTRDNSSIEFPDNSPYNKFYEIITAVDDNTAAHYKDVLRHIDYLANYLRNGNVNIGNPSSDKEIMLLPDKAGWLPNLDKFRADEAGYAPALMVKMATDVKVDMYLSANVMTQQDSGLYD